MLFAIFGDLFFIELPQLSLSILQVLNDYFKLIVSESFILSVTLQHLILLL
jgi:hypothetical protein